MSNRLLSVNQLIKKELSQIILKEVETLPGVLITLTRVETFPNLSESKVYISCLPEEKTKDVIRSLNRQIYRLQQELNHKLNMRPIPKIIFVVEKEMTKASKVEEILAKLKLKK